MEILIVSILTIISYVVAAIFQSLNLMGFERYAKWWAFGLGFCAVCLHGLLLHHWIDLQAGQNLNFFNMISLTVWLVSVIVLVMVLYRSIEVLVIFSFPVSAISILLVFQFPQADVIKMAVNPDALFHILLSILTFCILCVAGLLALLLAFQDSMLRKKRGGGFIVSLLPLESLERLLFQMNGFGFVLLSVLTVTSLYFYHQDLFENKAILQKTVLTVAAWVVFAVLLLGRLVWGWRGRTAIYGTLIGFALLFFIYFGSKILLEV